METSKDDQEKKEIEPNEYQLEDKIIFGKYLVKRKLNDGSSSKIYIGIKINTSNEKKEKVIFKFEPKIVYPNLLKNEALLLFLLKGYGVPIIKTYGKYNDYNVLIESSLGKSLERILNDEGGILNHKDCCMIALQIIDRLEHIHSKYYIHCDIKPEKFLIGDPDIYNIYLIDFGLAKKYKSSRTKKHIPFSITKKFTGSVRYASCNALRGAELSRRDDIESAGYTILYLFKGKLPWQNLKAKSRKQKLRRIYKIKKYLKPEKMCENLPTEMAEYIKYVRTLEFEAKPDYDRLRSYFDSILIRIGTVNDMRFSWIKDEKILEKIDKKSVKYFRASSMGRRKESPQARILKNILLCSSDREKSLKTMQSGNISKDDDRHPSIDSKNYQTNTDSDINIIFNEKKILNSNTLTNLKVIENNFDINENNSVKRKLRKKKSLKNDETSTEVDLKTIKTRINMIVEEDPGETDEEENNNIDKNSAIQKKLRVERSERVKRKLNLNDYSNNNQNNENKIKNNWEFLNDYSDMEQNNIFNFSEQQNKNNFNQINNNNNLYKNNNIDKLRMNKEYIDTNKSIEFNNNTNYILRNSSKKNNKYETIQKKLFINNNDTGIKHFNSNFKISKIQNENNNDDNTFKKFLNSKPNTRSNFNLNDLNTVNSFNFYNIKGEKYLNDYNFNKRSIKKTNNNQTKYIAKYSNNQINKTFIERNENFFPELPKNSLQVYQQLTTQNTKKKLVNKNKILNPNLKSNSTYDLISKKCNNLNSNNKNEQFMIFDNNNMINKRCSMNLKQKNNKLTTRSKLTETNFVDQKNMNKNINYYSNINYNKISYKPIDRNNTIINKNILNNKIYNNTNIIKEEQNESTIANDIINNVNNEEQVLITSFQDNKYYNYNLNRNDYNVKLTTNFVKVNPTKNNNINYQRINNRINNNFKSHCLIYRGIKRDNELENKNFNITPYSKEKRSKEDNETFQQSYRNTPNIIRSKVAVSRLNINNNINNKPMDIKNNVYINNRYKFSNVAKFGKLNLNDI